MSLVTSVNSRAGFGSWLEAYKACTPRGTLETLIPLTLSLPRTHHYDMATLHADRPASVRSNGLDIDKKEEFVHVEDPDVEEKAIAQDPNADYSGFTQKTDPVEIKLVRKLDMYIMVCDFLPVHLRRVDKQTSLWSMYWLNYLDRNAIALAKSEPPC